MKSILLTFALALFFVSCGQSQQADKQAEDGEISQNEEVERLKELDREIQQNPENITEARAVEIALQFSEFARVYPDAEEAVQFLFKAAELYISQPGKALYGIELFARIHQDYPTHALAPNAFFMMGMTFDAILQDNQRALTLYEGFLQQYPEHELAEEVKNLINLKKSPDGELEQVRAWMNQLENK
jgi:outer membrane protein assembly factor BamD (BamD/ComL family)